MSNSFGPDKARGVGCGRQGRAAGRRAAVLAAALLLAPGFFGCSPEAAGVKLLCYCGAGIRPPVAELAERFHRRYGVVVECDYAGSEILLTRIKLSGQGDVYLPGDVSYVEQAGRDGLIDRQVRVCYFIPVILVPKGNPKSLRGLADLTRPGIRLGLGDAEACAIGRQSARLFRKNHIPEVSLAGNVRFRSLTVNELGDKVKLGALDAVIVWDGVAACFAGSTEVVPIPPEQNVISTVAAATLSSSRHPEWARRFLEFLVSDEGKAVFRKHHYSLTLSEGAPVSPAQGHPEGSVARGRTEGDANR